MIENELYSNAQPLLLVMLPSALDNYHDFLGINIPLIANQPISLQEELYKANW